MYEREAVLGRDARDVFPTQAKQQAGGLDPDALKELLGARNFISESEVSREYKFGETLGMPARWKRQRQWRLGCSQSQQCIRALPAPLLKRLRVIARAACRRWRRLLALKLRP